jgi:hypothetical protein
MEGATRRLGNEVKQSRQLPSGKPARGTDQRGEGGGMNTGMRPAPLWPVHSSRFSTFARMN